MGKSVRCRECRKLFAPDPRVGRRQHTCSLDECQRSRHTKACQDWRRRTRPDRQEARLRRRLLHRRDNTVSANQASSASPVEAEARDGASPPSGAATGSRVGSTATDLDWEVVQDEIGLQIAVIIREIHRNLVSRIETGDRRLRDEILRQLSNTKGKSAQPLTRSGRDEMDSRGGGP